MFSNTQVQNSEVGLGLLSENWLSEEMQWVWIFLLCCAMSWKILVLRREEPSFSYKGKKNGVVFFKIYSPKPMLLLRAFYSSAE